MKRLPDAPDRTTREVPMRVIVHGVHRTGTLSVRTALHMLGVFECYHMTSVIDYLDKDGPLWMQAIKAKYNGEGEPWTTREEWDRILVRSQACIDVPAAAFSVELAQAYPEAKCVILNRDPEAWYASALESVEKVTKPQNVWDMVKGMYCAAFNADHLLWIRFNICLYSLVMPFDHAKEKDKAIAWYKKSYKDFRDAVPADRCLEFSVKDGWKPLCEFLNVPVPQVLDEKTGTLVDAPFPRVNDRKNFINKVQTSKENMLRETHWKLLTAVVKLTTMGVAGYGGYVLWKTRLGGKV